MVKGAKCAELVNQLAFAAICCRIMAMAKLKVQTGTDNPILRSIATEVRDLSAKTPAQSFKFGDFVKLMKKTLADEKGLGLAAPQVGESLRVILCRMDAGSDRETLFVMINPEILEMSCTAEELAEANAKIKKGGWRVGAGRGDGHGELPFGVEVGEEGCLSLPKQYMDVARAASIVVRFKDGRGFLKGSGRARKASELSDVELGLHGMNARVVQHEVDHLNGVLICDKG